MIIRPIQSADNKPMASIIRESLKVVGLDKPGTAYYDPSLEDLAGAYGQDGQSVYVVAEKNEKVVGGAGLAPMSDDLCELQKLYVVAEARGNGIGRALLEAVIAYAKRLGYGKIYLETTDVLSHAVSLYEDLGFKHLEAPIANDSGHHAMTIWMLKTLEK